MKPDIKKSKALVVGGIILASAFFITAIFSPKSLDWILHPSEERSDQIKKEMDRQKGIGSDGQPDARPGKEGEANSGAMAPTPSPEAAAPAGEGEIRVDDRIPKPECISRDHIVNAIYASEEAKAGRVISVNVTPDGGRIMVAYMKKTFLGIGSGENQIEGILRRGLRNSFPDRLIKSVKVRSDGKRSVLRGERNVNAEVLVIEPLQSGCRLPSASVESR
jgi:hypothetical protein